jgi:hypothetical protein
MATKCLPHRIYNPRDPKLTSDIEYPYIKPVLVFERTINDRNIRVFSQADYEFKAHRHSYSIGTHHHSGGYGHENEIVFPTIMDAFFDALSNSVREEDFKQTKREFILEELL